MQNRSSAEAITEVASPEPGIKAADPSPPNWTAIVAIVISIITLLKSLWTDAKGATAKREATFEAHYGSDIRSGLRAFETKIKPLRVFTLPSARTLDQLKTEIETASPDWQDASFEFGRLLDEVDEAGQLCEPGWGQAFRDNSERAEISIEKILIGGATNIDELTALAKAAHDDYAVAVAEIRNRLRRQLVALRKIRGPRGS